MVLSMLCLQVAEREIFLRKIIPEQSGVTVLPVRIAEVLNDSILDCL